MNTISTKDLDNLKNIYKWNFEISKLSYHLSLQTSNPIVKDMILKVRNMHNEECLKIKKILMEVMNEKGK